MIGDFYVPENRTAGSSPLNSTSELLVTSSNFDGVCAHIGPSRGYLTPLRASCELSIVSYTIECGDFHKETTAVWEHQELTLPRLQSGLKKLKIHEFCEHDIVTKRVAVDPLLLADWPQHTTNLCQVRHWTLKTLPFSPLQICWKVMYRPLRWKLPSKNILPFLRSLWDVLLVCSNIRSNNPRSLDTWERSKCTAMISSSKHDVTMKINILTS